MAKIKKECLQHNMFNYNDTLILFGRSTYINKIADDIPKLCKKYHTMGCNYFCNTFPMVEYVIFHDDIVPDTQEHQTIITNILYLRRKKSQCNKLLENHDKKELFVIHKNGKRFAQDATSLNFFIHTPSMAFDWAHKRGFKNVILAGIDLSADNKHFDYKTTPDQNGHTFLHDTLIKAREHLTSIAVQYLNIYQLNPDNDINIPKIKIADLL